MESFRWKLCKRRCFDGRQEKDVVRARMHFGSSDTRALVAHMSERGRNALVIACEIQQNITLLHSTPLAFKKVNATLQTGLLPSKCCAASL